MTSVAAIGAACHVEAAADIQQCHLSGREDEIEGRVLRVVSRGVIAVSASVSVSRRVSLATWLATTVAGSGPMLEVRTPNGPC